MSLHKVQTISLLLTKRLNLGLTEIKKIWLKLRAKNYSAYILLMINGVLDQFFQRNIYSRNSIVNVLSFYLGSE